MMPQQSNVYQGMMNNQQANVYNQTGGNPTLNRTPSQPPMTMPNQQWPNRPPQNAYNQVKFMWTSPFTSLFRHLSDDGT